MTKTGAHRGLTADTVCSTRVLPSNTAVALSRPIRRDAPPARRTAASGTRDVTSVRLVDGPGVLAAEQRLQCSRVVRLGVARRCDLTARSIVVGRLAHLAENARDH